MGSNHAMRTSQHASILNKNKNAPQAMFNIAMRHKTVRVTVTSNYCRPVLFQRGHLLIDGCDVITM